MDSFEAPRLRIACVGGGPAGLYFSILMKLASPASHVTVLERNPAGVTYGWGVVFWATCSTTSVGTIHRALTKYTGALSHGPARSCASEARRHTSGSGLGSASAADACSTSCPGVRPGSESISGYSTRSSASRSSRDADLIVACDGVNSRVRQERADHFRTEVDVGRNKYMARHPEDLRRLHVCVRANGRGVDLVPCLPCRPRDEHLHRRMPS